MVDIISSAARVADGEFLPKFRRRYMLETLGRNRFGMYMGEEDSHAIQYIYDNKDDGESIQLNFLREIDDMGVAGGMRLRGVEATPQREKMILRWEYQRNATGLKKSEEKKSIVELAPQINELFQKWSKRMMRYRIVDALRMVAPDKTFSAPKYSISASKVLAGFPALVQPTSTVAPASAETAAWLANNQDRILFGADDANFSSTANLSTNLGNVSGAGEGATLSLLRRAHDRAKNSSPFIEPLYWAERDASYFVAFCDSFSFRQLQLELQTINTNAQAREGNAYDRNPIATGSDMIYDGLIITEIPDIKPLVLDGAVWRDRVETDSSEIKATSKGQIYICGRQSVAVGIAQEPKVITDRDDYDFIKGTGIEEALSVNKFQRQDLTTTTKYVDFGMVTAFTDATQQQA